MTKELLRWEDSPGLGKPRDLVVMFCDHNR